jgi:preprotein translocase subunit SecG
MISFLTLLIILGSVILGFFILIQNPKGGGLTGTFGSMSSQMMGVKQSTDIMEKGTWTMIGAVAGLCLISVMFFQKTQSIETRGKEVQQKSTPAKKK